MINGYAYEMHTKSMKFGCNQLINYFVSIKNTNNLSTDTIRDDQAVSVVCMSQRQDRTQLVE